MAHCAIRLDVGLINEVLVALEPIEVPAASMLAFVTMINPSSYLVVLLPTLNGLDTWGAWKVNEESLVNTKEFAFFINAVDFAEAKLLTRQRICSNFVPLRCFYELLSRGRCWKCGSDIKIFPMILGDRRVRKCLLSRGIHSKTRRNLHSPTPCSICSGFTTGVSVSRIISTRIWDGPMPLSPITTMSNMTPAPSFLSFFLPSIIKASFQSSRTFVNQLETFHKLSLLYYFLLCLRTQKSPDT